MTTSHRNLKLNSNSPPQSPRNSFHSRKTSERTPTDWFLEEVCGEARKKNEEELRESKVKRFEFLLLLRSPFFLNTISTSYFQYQDHGHDDDCVRTTRWRLFMYSKRASLGWLLFFLDFGVFNYIMESTRRQCVSGDETIHPRQCCAVFRILPSQINHHNWTEWM